MCGLEAYADAIVGSLGVEHRKRTTIGVELAAKVRLFRGPQECKPAHMRPNSPAFFFSWTSQPPVWTRNQHGPLFRSSASLQITVRPFCARE